MRQLIDATSLDQWFTGRRRDAQELLPHLVRKLIAATVQPGALIALRIPVGDDIRRRGFDGTVEVTVPSAYVPAGKSVWEMGTNADPKAKADADFMNRTADASVDKSFMFVTPHAWDGKTQWVADHASGGWGSVRAYDNVELAAWLEDAPAVARWLARQMGIPSPAIRDLELFSREVQETYGVDLSDDLIISGRTEALNNLHEWLKGSGPIVRVEGQWSGEAAGFIGAAVRKLPTEQAEFIESRLCFVDSPEALEHLASLSSTHFVVPLNFDTARRARALRSSTLRLLIPTARTVGPQDSGQDVIRLGSVKRRACEVALMGMGIPQQRAERIAIESKGRLSAILWMIAREQENPLAWTSGVTALELVPLVLAGQWSADSVEDRKVIEQLTARSYPDVERTLASWQTPVGPLIRRGELWDWLAWDFAWIALAPHMDAGVVSRFRQVVKLVLSTRDPSLDLEPNQRFAAPIYGKTHPYSVQLRIGLVGSLIQFALTDQHSAGTSGQAIADGIVRDLLSGEGSTMKDAWQSLSRLLPDLAEAAPNAFISSVQRFREDPEAVAALFTGADFFGPNPHVHLLWALERLAWSREFFTQAVSELLELAAVDPGGKLRNRPDQSLMEIFRPWHPQTSADVSHRLDAFDVLYSRRPDIVWRVAVALLPSDHDVASPTASPEWRLWKPANLGPPPTDGYWQFVEGLVRRMTSWAREKPERWNDLIRNYLQLHESHSDLAKGLLVAFQGITPNELPNDTRAELTSTLRDVLSWHEEFDDENSDDTRLTALSDLHARLEPEEPLFKYAWLFVGWPRLSRGKNVN